MEKTEVPPDFDWVTARRECSIVAFFQRLASGAEKNVNARNDSRTTEERHGGMKFAFAWNGDVFTVFHEGHAGQAVRIRVEGTRIVVESNPSGVRFDGTLTLTNEARCRLRVGTEELDEWQVLRRALEPLLFPT